MKRWKIILGLVWTLLTSQALGAKTKILTLNNIDEKSRFDLHIEKDEDERAVGLALWDPQDNTWTEFDTRTLRRGMPVKEEGSHKVIVLKSLDFESDRGGNFTVDYLKNGITGSRAALPIEFDFDGRSWKVFYRGTQIKGLNFKLNKVFGKTVGIKQVTPHK